MTIYIGSKHHGIHSGIVVYCGRPSILQNPYVIGKHGNRNEVCDLYQKDFARLVKIEGPFRNEVIRLYKLAKTIDITLLCFCTPNRCHCDTIKNFLNIQLNKGK